MKKAILAAAIILLVISASYGQNYWHIKTSLQGVFASPADSKGAALGAGLVASFGPPDARYEVGFEVRKWFRDYTVFDPLMKAYSDSGILRVEGLPDGDPIDKSDGQSNYDDSGLSFATLFKYRFFELTPSIGIYSGAGTGMYFIQAKREKVVQNQRTGFWYIEKEDYYLETKIQVLMLTGVDGKITAKLDYFLEGRFTYIADWDRWDDPYVFDGSVGLRYNF